MKHRDFRSTPTLSWVDALFACPGRLELFGPGGPIPGSQRLLKPIDPDGRMAVEAIARGAHSEVFYPTYSCGSRAPISQYRVTGGDMKEFKRAFVKTDRDTLLVYPLP